MIMETIQTWLAQNPAWAPWVVLAGLILFSVIVFLFARFLIARGLVALAKRTENQYDDIIVEELRPFRFAWLAPLLVIYFFANLLPEGTVIVQQIVVFLILWISILTISSLFNAFNAIYEASRWYHGEPIQGWLDLGKVLLIVVGIILSISMFTGQSPIVLLSGLGAVMAILILVFRDTILSFVASVQIQANDLILEGDALEVPSYEADGTVLNISLYSVTVQNWDKSITTIPTYKLVEVPYKNWRGMEESGGRRIKRSIHIDQNSIGFCTPEMIERLREIELIEDYIDDKLAEFEEAKGQQATGPGNPVGEGHLTNIGVFRRYVIRYLKGRDDLHQEELTLLVRQLAPSPMGLPLEIYVFTSTIDWMTYENIQAEIFDHLIAALPQFGLRLFQQPTGSDFQVMTERIQ